mgnify:FL=1
MGSTRLFASLGPFYSNHFSPMTPVLPSHIVCANGLTPMLDTLGTVLCDPGEAFLVPTPYYNAFRDDLRGKAGVELLDGIVSEGQHGEMGEIAALERTMEENVRAGRPTVRAVLVTNPHNPLGPSTSRCLLL